MNNDDYQELVNNYKPKENKISNAFSAFIIGGLLGFISEFISFLLIKYFNISKDESYQIIGLVMIIFTCFLTTIGIFDNFVSKAKCGLVIPTTGFAHSIASTILDYKREGFITGIGSNAFKLAGSVIVYGIIFAFLFCLVKVVLL